MGRASRGKAERRRLRERRSAEDAARQGPARAEPARRGLLSFLTADGPPSDFPLHAGLGALLLVLLVVVSYYPAVMAGFVWDDVIFYDAKPVREWSGLWDIWFNPKSLAMEGHYWPVLYTSFWLDHKLWGFEPAGYHAVNILLQSVNTLLVWRLMLRFAVPGAWLIAAVFAVHPLHVESVAWVIARKDLLSGLFYMAAVLVWLRFRETPRWGLYLGALGLFAASLLSKTVTVTLPAVLLVLVWWKRGRVTVADGLPLLPFFVAGFAITLGDLGYYTSREPLALDFSLAERLQIASHALWFYVGKIVWPVDLAVIYPFWDVGVGNLAEWGYVAAAFALAAGLWLARKRVGRGPLAGALFFLVTLSPVLGFVDYGYMQFSFVADRFQYLAGIGVLAVFIGAGTRAAGRLPAGTRKGVLGVALLGVAALAGLSWKQSHVYRDPVVFFSHIIAHNPQARDAHLNLGNALWKAGRRDEMLAPSRIAVQQRPDSAPAYNNLGLALRHRDELDEAEQVFRRGWEIDPRDKRILMNLGETIRRQGRPEESLQWYDAFLKLERDAAMAHAGKGDALFHLGRHDEAVVHLRKALSLEPNMAQAPLIHVLIGDAEQEMGRFEAAKRHYEYALEADPALTRAHAALLDLLLDRQRDAEVERHLQAVRNTARDDPAVFQKVAELFRKRQEYERALGWYDEVLRIDPDFARAHAGRGDALFRLKRHEEAIESLDRAIALEPTMSTVPTLRTLMGEAHQVLGRLGAASEQYELVLQDHPGHAAAIDRLAMVRFKEGRYEDALRLYQTYLELVPDSANTYTNLGVVLYKAGRFDEARRHLERALSMDPEATAAQSLLEAIRGESQ